MIDKLINWSKKGLRLVQFLKACVAGLEAFQKELSKVDSGPSAADSKSE